TVVAGEENGHGAPPDRATPSVGQLKGVEELLAVGGIDEAAGPADHDLVEAAAHQVDTRLEPAGLAAGEGDADDELAARVAVQADRLFAHQGRPRLAAEHAVAGAVE